MLHISQTIRLLLILFFAGSIPMSCFRMIIQSATPLKVSKHNINTIRYVYIYNYPNLLDYITPSKKVTL